MAYKERASSAEYLRITSPFSSWYSRREMRMMSPWLIQIFFRSLPRIRPRRLTPSKHCILLSAHCFLCVRVLWPGNAYHGIESAVAQHLEDLGVLLAFLLEGELALLIAVNPSVSDCEMVKGEDGRGSATHSFSFFPLRRFLPPFPLFLGILTERALGDVPDVNSGVGKSRR